VTQADWLKDGASHCHVGRDFVDTDRGVKKLEDVIAVEEDEPESSMSYYPPSFFG
jgi:hypothetical protein